MAAIHILRRVRWYIRHNSRQCDNTITIKSLPAINARQGFLFHPADFIDFDYIAPINPSEMNIGFIQTNTRKLSVEEQKAEIESFCNREHIALDRWEDKSDSLLNQVKAYDLVICIELYFLSDSIYTVMEILSHCMEIGCKVWSIREGHRLGDNEMAKDMALAFDLYAEVKRKLISTQTKKALSLCREEGISLGRPSGSLLY